MLSGTYLQLISYQAFTTVIAFHFPPAAGEFKVLLQFLLQDKLTTGVRARLRFEATIPLMGLQVKAVNMCMFIRVWACFARHAFQPELEHLLYDILQVQSTAVPTT